ACSARVRPPPSTSPDRCRPGWRGRSTTPTARPSSRTPAGAPAPCARSTSDYCMPERLYVVDGYSNLFRAYHAVEYLSTSRGVPSHAVLILSTMLWKLIREEQPDYLGIASDAPGATFRDRLFD